MDKAALEGRRFSLTPSAEAIHCSQRGHQRGQRDREKYRLRALAACGGFPGSHEGAGDHVTA